jgi:LemA protein
MQWIGIVVVILVLVILVLVYNRLVSLQQSSKEAFSNIDAQIRARTDLIPNLVATVKGYAAHEADTLEAVMKARTASVNAGRDREAAVSADQMLTSSLGRLLAVAEAYPDLKASSNFMQLQSELADIENKLAAARRFFNSAVADYNGALDQFPAVLFAKSFGFKPDAMFTLPAETREQELKAPAVSF